MELIQNNPYRIAGILSNSSQRELERNKGKFSRYIKVGKAPESEFDFELLGHFERTEKTLQRAFSKLEQSKDKVDHALFWFVNASPFDNTAIEYLQNSEEEKAVEIWQKITLNKEVSSKNFSAFNNLGTYKLLSQDQDDIKQGIEAKIKLVESDYFKTFVHTVADETYRIDNEKQIEKLIDELLEQFKDQYSSSKTLELFSNCNGSAQKYLSEKFTEEPIYKIESQIENCKKNRKADKENGYELGLSLHENTKEDLLFLKSLLGTTNLKYKAVADGLANEMMQSAIDYFNESQKNDSTDDYLQSAEKLTKIAKTIAVGKLATDKADDNLATLDELKEKEINQAIQVMQSVKNTYYKNMEELLQKMVDEGIPTDEIDTSKVSRMIEDSIDWDRATIMIKSAIPKRNINKIKNTEDISKINKYKDLVKFVSVMVGSYNSKKISYLKYWQAETEKNDTQQEQSNSNITSTQSGSPSNKKKGIFWEVIIKLILLCIPVGAYVIWGWTPVIIMALIFISILASNK